MENGENGLSEISDVIESVVTGIPAPVRKSFFKVFAQLCTASVDIPVAWLESRSAEIRASSEARLQIIHRSGEIISGKMEVPKDIISRASLKYAGKVIREQVNLDDITLNAAKELATPVADIEFQESTEIKDISDDWLNEFEDIARLKSSEDMKLVFGKILAGEIKSPGRFSIKTLKVISELDNKAAELFQLVCSLAVSSRYKNDIQDVRVVSFESSPAHNSLRKFGLSFENLNVLQEYGLIITDYNSNFHYTSCMSTDAKSSDVTLRFQNKDYVFLQPEFGDYNAESFKFSGVQLTKCGNELLDIIPTLSEDETSFYKKSLFEYFASKKINAVEIKGK